MNLNTNKEVLHYREVDLAVSDLWYNKREPRRHMTANLRREKLNLQRSICCMAAPAFL